MWHIWIKVTGSTAPLWDQCAKAWVEEKDAREQAHALKALFPLSQFFIQFDDDTPIEV